VHAGSLKSYPLLFRASPAAWRVWRMLPERRVNPSLGPAIRAVDEIYLAPQPGWKITEPEKIAKIADLLTRLPLTWGRCVQHLAHHLSPAQRVWHPGTASAMDPG
jgi:hypothetical protein